MTKVNIASEGDMASPLDFAPIRSRVGHGRHSVVDPTAFPDLLDEIKTSRSDLHPVPSATENEAGVEAEREVGATGIEQKIDVSDVSDEMNAYLQKLATFMQMPVQAPVAGSQTMEMAVVAEESAAELETLSAGQEYSANLAMSAIPQVSGPKSEVDGKSDRAGNEISEAGAPILNPVPVRAAVVATPVAGTLVTLMDKISSGNFETGKAELEQATWPDINRPGTVLPKPQFLMRAPPPQQEAAIAVLQSPSGTGAEQRDAPIEEWTSLRIETTEIEPQVLKVETSFAPATPVSLVTQFSRAVAAGLEGFVQGLQPAMPAVVHDPRRDVVKNLQLRLHPADLGEIKVGMHLRGDELHLRIEVTTRQVESILQNDRQILRELISKAGYDIADAAISISHSTGELAPSQQRDASTFSPLQDQSVGQGSRHYPGAGPENRNQFQNSRGSQGFRREFQGDDNAKIPAAEITAPRRRGSVYI